MLTMPVARRIEVFTGAGRRRRWSAEAKAEIVAESHASTVGEVADRYGLAKTQIFTWRRDARRAAEDPRFAQVVVDEAPSPQPVIEVHIGPARVRIPPGADHQMAATVLTALRAVR